MADTIGRTPLLIIDIVVGILLIDLIGIFFYGSYSGLGSSLKMPSVQKRRSHKDTILVNFHFLILSFIELIPL